MSKRISDELRLFYLQNEKNSMKNHSNSRHGDSNNSTCESDWPICKYLIMKQMTSMEQQEFHIHKSNRIFGNFVPDHFQKKAKSEKSKYRSNGRAKDETDSLNPHINLENDSQLSNHFITEQIYPKNLAKKDPLDNSLIMRCEHACSLKKDISEVRNELKKKRDMLYYLILTHRRTRGLKNFDAVTMSRNGKVKRKRKTKGGSLGFPKGFINGDGSHEIINSSQEQSYYGEEVQGDNYNDFPGVTNSSGFENSDFQINCKIYY